MIHTYAEKSDLYLKGAKKISEAIEKTFKPDYIISFPLLQRGQMLEVTVEEVCSILNQLNSTKETPINIPLSFYFASEILSKKYTAYQNPLNITLLILSKTLDIIIPETEIAENLCALNEEDYSEMLYLLLFEKGFQYQETETV